MMNNLLMENVFFLEGWRHPEAGSHDVPRPSYQESAFKLVCPVASKHLPLRQKWLEMMSRHAGGVCGLQHLGALVAKPAGSRGLSCGADTENASDVVGVATSNVMWQVTSVAALRCQALEKLGRFIFAWEALAPSLAKAPRICQEWVRQLDMAKSELRSL